MSTFSNDGAELEFDDHGQGEPVILIHGHPFDRTMWQPQVEYLSAAGYRVVALDLRGYGGSSVVPGKTTLDVFARDIVQLLGHLSLDRVILAGLSMGGQIAMEFVRLFEDRVRGLVLADTSPGAETEDGKRSRNEMADRLLREGMGPYAEEALSQMIAPRNVESLPDVARHVFRMMNGTPPEGAAAALRGRAERLDYLDLITTMKVPTLVVVGSEDAFTPVEEAELMHERIPDWTLVVIDGAGHMPNLERPTEFNSAFEDFLSRVS